MANTYTQIYHHYVFTVKDRTSVINPEWEHQLYRYITGIVQEQGHKLMTVNGMPDHIHLLVSMNPHQSSSQLIYFVKRSSSLWINRNGFVRGKFSWQEGYGAFSCAKTGVSRVARYIENQKNHHRKKSFLEEYIDLLEAYEIEFNNRYLFKPVFY